MKVRSTKLHTYYSRGFYSYKLCQFFAFFILLTALPYQAASLALPDPAATTDVKVTDSPDDSLFELLADDEWLMVLYNEHEDGGQCGGTSRKVSGNGGACIKVQDDKCVDLKAAVSVASIGFSWKSKAECKGDQVKYSVVQGGTDNNGVDLEDEIKFVAISSSYE